MPDLEGGEHVVVYRAVADFRQLLAAVAKAKAELKALSGDTTGKAGTAGAAEKLKRDVEAYTRARVDGANRVALAEHLADQRVAKTRVDGERQVEQAVQKTVKTEQVSLDLQKAAVEAEKALAAAKERTVEAEARHAKQAREISNARTAATRAQGALDKRQQALADRPTGPDATEASELHALQQRLAEATARAERADVDRATTSAALRRARSTQKAAERFVAASQVEPIPIQPPSTKRHPKPLAQPEPAPPAAVDRALTATATDDIHEIRRRIIKAYADAIAEGSQDQGDFVSLSRIRPKLADIERSAVDEQLKELARGPSSVNIVPESNQKTLTRAQRDASLVIGDQDKHLISMSPQEALRHLPGPDVPHAPSVSAPTADVNLLRDLRRALDEIKHEPGKHEFVSLADLRQALGQYSRQEQDAAFRQFEKTLQTTLLPQANQRALTARQHEAALPVGGVDQHALVVNDEVRQRLDDILARHGHQATAPAPSAAGKSPAFGTHEPDVAQKLIDAVPKTAALTPPAPVPAPPKAKVRSGRIPTADEAAALTREDLDEAIAKFSGKSATGRVLRDESMRRAHNAILGSEPGAGIRREPEQVAPVTPPATSGLPRGRIPTVEQTRALSREDLDEAVARFSAKSGTGKALREELARREPGTAPAPAPTPEPAPPAAPKPAIRRRTIPPEQIAVLSREELNEHLANYPPTSKTGQALRDESLRRGHQAILTPTPPPTPSTETPGSQQHAVSAAPGHLDGTAEERALQVATAETKNAQEKLAAARVRVADQEELLGDAKDQYLDAKATAERVRADVLKRAGRAGQQLTPEQLSTAARVRDADQGVRAAQGPVRTTHADLEAARAEQAAAQRALETAKAAEAAAKANAEAAGRSERAAASSAVAAEAAGKTGESTREPRTAAVGRREPEPALTTAPPTVTHPQPAQDAAPERTQAAEPRVARDAAPADRLARAETGAAESADRLAHALHELETHTQALADAEEHLDRAHADQAPASEVFHAEDTHGEARAEADSAHQAALSAQAADAAARTELRSATAASRPAPQHALSAAPTPQPAPSDLRDPHREPSAPRPAQAAAAKPERDAAPAVERTAPKRRRTKAETDAERALVQAEKELEVLRQRTEELATQHQGVAKDVSNAKSAQTRARKAIDAAGDDSDKRAAAQARLTAADERAAQAVAARDVTGPQLTEARAAQRRAEADAAKLRVKAERATATADRRVETRQAKAAAAATPDAGQAPAVRQTPATKSALRVGRVPSADEAAALTREDLTQALSRFSDKSATGKVLGAEAQRRGIDPAVDATKNERLVRAEHAAAESAERLAHSLRELDAHTHALATAEEHLDRAHADQAPVSTVLDAEGVRRDARADVEAAHQASLSARADAAAARTELRSASTAGRPQPQRALDRAPLAVRETTVEAAQALDRMRHFEDGLDRVNRSLGVTRTRLDDVNVKTKFFADRLGQVTAITEEQFNALKHFRDGLTRTEGVLFNQNLGRANQPALGPAPERRAIEAPQPVGVRNFETFAHSLLDEIQKRPQHQIASGPTTGATASYWESLDRNVRHVNQALETRSVERFNTGLDKVTGDLRQTFLANIEHVAQELRASIVGTVEDFDHFNKSLDDVDHRLQSNFRARPAIVPRQTDQDLLRRVLPEAPEARAQSPEETAARRALQEFVTDVNRTLREDFVDRSQAARTGDHVGTHRPGLPAEEGQRLHEDVARTTPTKDVAIRRDDIAHIVGEFKKLRDEPGFVHAPDAGARQQKFTEEGRTHRTFHAEGDLYDDRPPYQPMRPALPSGIGGHDTLHAPSSYPGSNVGGGAFNPKLSQDKPSFMTGQASQRFATRALEGGAPPPLRGSSFLGGTRDTLRTKRYKAEGRRIRSFSNMFKAVKDTGMDDLGKRSQTTTELKSRLDDLSDVVPKLTGQFGYWEKIIIAVLAALVTLIPAIATLAAGVGALLSAAGAAVAGLAVFGLAAVGVFGRLKTAIDDNAKSGKAIPQVYQQAASAFKGLKSAYNEFLNDTQGDVLGVFTQGLTTAASVIHRFVPIVHSVAGALQDVIGQIGAASKTDTFARFLSFVGSTGSRAIISFSRTLLLFGQGLAELAMAFGPYIATILHGVEGLAASFERFAASRSGSDSFKQFMQYAIDSAPKVGAFLGALVSGFAHLGAALAPLGGNLLTVITLFLRLINAIPTSALSGLIEGFVSLWGALRLFLGMVAVVKMFIGFYEAMNKLAKLAAVQQAIAKLTTMFPRLAASMEIAEGGALSLKGALIGLAASAGIFAILALVVGGVLSVMSNLSASNDAAAEATKRHKDAVADLADQLRETNGVMTEGIRTTRAQALQETQTVDVGTAGSVSGFVRGALGMKPASTPVDFSVAGEAKKAGISLPDLTGGSLGDPLLQQGSERKFQDRIDSLEKQRLAKQKTLGRGAKAGDDPDLKNFDKEIASAKAAKAALDTLAVTTGELAQKQKTLGDLVGDTGAVIDANIGPTATLTDRYKALLGILAKGDQSTVIDQAVQAYDAYNEAVKEQTRAQEAMAKAHIDSARSIADAKQRIANASQAVIEAQQNEKVAQENLTKAREDAAAQLEDYRRTLRDIPLDEEQNSINLQKAIDDERKSRAAPGATGLDRRQAQLDLKRAQNASSDGLIDDQRKRTDATRGLATQGNIETSDTVIAAKNALHDATTGLASANQELQRSMQDLPFVQQAAREAIIDAQHGFDVATQKVNETGRALADAAANAGVTADQLKGIKAAQQDLERDITLHLGLDSGTTLADLRQTALDLQALRLMAANPSLTYAQARDQAAAIINGSVRDVAAIHAASGFGGRGQSQSSASRAAGGAIEGPGTATSDSVPTNLSTGEHVWTAAEVVAVGGHTMVKAIREAALNRKSAATSPQRYYEATGLLRAASIPGRGGSTDPAHLSSAMFTAGLNVAAAALPVAAPTAAPARAVVIDNSVHHHGAVSTGDITINNPVKEQAGGSLYRSIRRLRRDYD
jgi:hypothetical protein